MEENTTGARRATPAGLRALRAPAPEHVTGVSRKELSAAARDAGEALSLRPSQRQVLGELVGCYGEQMTAAGLMVWPSNDYLMRRTGLGERTVRLAIRDLIGLELIGAVDSANRKRFAIRTRGGEVLQAYGFSLNPLHAKRHDLAALVLKRRLEVEAQGRLFDRATVARKGIEAALRLLPDEGILREFVELLGALPRRGSMASIDRTVEALEALRDRIEVLVLGSESAGSEGTTCRHIESATYRSIDTCRDLDEGVGEIDGLRRACPAADSYGVRLNDALSVELAGESLRATIGAGPDAWSEAVKSIGRLRAAALVMVVLQLHDDDATAGTNRIRNPGGLYRALVRRVAKGEATVADEVRTLRRRRTN